MNSQRQQRRKGKQESSSGHGPDSKVGRKYGKWLVVEKAFKGPNNHWKFLCLCECGNWGVIYGNHLVEGRKTGCGCGRILMEKQLFTANDITGFTIGRWNVVKRLGRVDPEKPSAGYLYICQCACGTESELISTTLISKPPNPCSRSCGCLRDDLVSIKSKANKTEQEILKIESLRSERYIYKSNRNIQALLDSNQIRK